jgi:Ricin-type beta-trefoil lectin domain-like
MRPGRRLLSATLAALAAISVFALAGQGTALAATSASGPWIIQVYQDGSDSNEAGHVDRCAEVQGESTANSAQVQMYGCVSFARWQRWYFMDLGNGYFRIFNDLSAKCMNVQGASLSNSAKVIQYSCSETSTATNDQWKLVRVFRDVLDYYQLRNRHSGKCLNVQGASANNGADLVQYTCDPNGAVNDSFTWRHPSED